MVAVLGGLVVLLLFIVAGMWATIWEQRNQLAELREVRRSHIPNPWHVVVSHDRATLPELWPVGELDADDEPTQVCRIDP